MTKYTIDWIEVKTSSKGTKYAKVSVTDDNGSQITEAAIFADFPNFENLKAGTPIEADLVSKVYQGKTSYTLQKPVTAPKWATKPGGMGSIKAAQERKEVMIEKAQERKNESIAYFNAVNSAISLATSKNISQDDLKDFIIRWRDWFLSEWEKYDALPKDQKSQPF